MRDKGLNKAVGTSIYKGDVGIELEFEGDGLPDYELIEHLQSPESLAGWTVVRDGSLRNGGKEYVLTQPVKRSEIRHMVGGLFRTMSDHGTKIENTNRCSTHVHVNASGLKVNHITSALALWCTFGHAFIRWCGEERTHNHFCLSMQDEESLIEAWEDFVFDGVMPTKFGLKYTALNILPLWSQGSLEFRCGSAPDEPDKVVYWAKMCLALVQYAADNFRNPADIASALSEQGPSDLLYDILKSAQLGPRTTERIYWELTNVVNFDNLCMDCFRDFQHLVLGIRWHTLLDKIDAPNIPNPFERQEF